MATHTPKFGRRDQFTRSISDSHAGYIHHSVPKATLSNTSFDDTAVEFSNPKIAQMTTSNSMPNLAALNDEPLPDISEWEEFDLPFDLFESYCANNAEVILPYRSFLLRTITVPVLSFNCRIPSGQDVLLRVMQHKRK
jgi:hypothetical protein